MEFCQSRRIAKSLLAFFLSAFFFSCASTKKTDGAEISPVYITNSKKFYLLPPENAERDTDSLWLLNGAFQENRFTVQVYARISGAGIFLSLLNEFGTGMGELVYDGRTVAFDSAVFPKTVRPEYIAADLQFAYYKAEPLAEALRQIGLDFAVSSEDGAEIRRILDGKKCVEEIVRTDGAVKITNRLRGYEYDCQEAAE